MHGWLSGALRSYLGAQLRAHIEAADLSFNILLAYLGELQRGVWFKALLLETSPMFTVRCCDGLDK